MNTCKDCLHYEACNAHYSNIDIAEIPDDIPCDNFTNRSEWLHLPCKVGDKLYKVVPDFAKPRGNMTVQEYTVSGIGINVFVSNPYNAFGVHRIGADVFLTREEAEKALEGMNGDG